MNKTELIAEVAAKCAISKKDAEKTVNATFDTKHREAHMGRNPRTKEPVEIPATTVPVFKAGKALKDKVAK